jgi:hypothetical protein
MIAKNCPLESKVKLMNVLDGGCYWPYNTEPDKDLRIDWVYGMVDREKKRQMCEKCTLRKFRYTRAMKCYPELRTISTLPNP